MEWHRSASCSQIFLGLEMKRLQNVGGWMEVEIRTLEITILSANSVSTYQLLQPAPDFMHGGGSAFALAISAPPTSAADLSTLSVGQSTQTISAVHTIYPSNCTEGKWCFIGQENCIILMQISVMQLVLPTSVLVFLSSSCRRRVDGVDISRVWHKRSNDDGTVLPFRQRWC